MFTSYKAHNQSIHPVHAIAIVVYYNPQSILVSFPINTLAQRLLAQIMYLQLVVMGQYQDL